MDVVITIKVINGKHTVNGKEYKDLMYCEKQAFDNFIMNQKIKYLETIKAE